MKEALGDLSGRSLKFSEGNAKLKGIMSISLPAGHACPGANECFAKTVQIPGFKVEAYSEEKKQAKVNQCGFHVQDGPNCQFRCFAATDEAKYRATRMQRWHNFLLLKAAGTTPAIVDLIVQSLPKTFAPMRLHVAGDFYSQAYFDAWIEVAKRFPAQVFYAYTKSLPLWVARLGQIPSNLRLVASYGGKWDHLIAEHNLKFAKVCFTEKEAADLGLEIDHDDSHAYGTGGSFALLLHGTQPAGSPAAKAWSALKAVGKGGYHNQKAGRESLGTFYANKAKKRNAGGINSPNPIGLILKKTAGVPAP